MERTEAVPASGRAASSSTDWVGPPLAFALGYAGATLGALHEVLAQAPSLYLVGGFSASRAAIALLGLAAGVAGALVARRKSWNPWRALPFVTLALSLACAASGASYYAGFAHGLPLAPVGFGFAALTGALAGAALELAARGLLVTLRKLGAVETLANPFRLALLVLGAGLAAGVVSHLGVLRAGIAVGLGLAALAAWSPNLEAFLAGRVPRGARAVRLAAFAVLVVEAAGFVACERVVPAHELGRYANPIVFFRQTERQRFAVTSGQEALELQVDGRIVASSVDQERYYQALVQPALAAAPRRARVLLLGGGTGLAEREILRHSDVSTLQVVVVDSAIAELGRRQRWLRALSHDALASAKVRLIEQEPIVFLRERDERFDVAIVDLPDPDDYLQAKSYTRFFYQKLAERLAPDGVMVTQATSPFASPDAFADIVATMEAAGLGTLAYHAPVPTYGDWGFVLGKVGGKLAPADLAAAAPMLDGVTLDELAYVPKDLAPREAPETNLLHDQRLLDAFQREHERPGP